MIYPWQTAQWDYIKSRIATKTLPHGLLFAGPKGVGKYDFALSIASSILCENRKENSVACGACNACTLFKAATHPDLCIVQPEEQGKSIKIEQIRHIIEFLNKTTHRHN